MLITASSTCIPAAGGLSSHRARPLRPVSTLQSALGQGYLGTCLNVSHMLQGRLLDIDIVFWYCSPNCSTKESFRTWARRWAEIQTPPQVKRRHLCGARRHMGRGGSPVEQRLPLRLSSRAGYLYSPKGPVLRRAPMLGSMLCCHLHEIINIFFNKEALTHSHFALGNINCVASPGYSSRRRGTRKPSQHPGVLQEHLKWKSRL